MDSLDELPFDEEESDVAGAPQRREAINKFTGGPKKRTRFQRGNKSQDSSDSPSGESDNKWKIIGYITVVFLVLANPWIQTLLTRIPYVGGSQITEFLFTTVIFIIAVIVITMYM